MADRLDRIEALKALAEEYNIRSPAKLRQQSALEGVGVTTREAQEALKNDVARQVFAPKPRSLGKSAAEGPNDRRLQFDLIDFSNNTSKKNPYRFALTGIDVYTREMAAVPIKTKGAQEVNTAFKKAVKELVDDETNYVVSTDQGLEFSRLGEALPPDAVHRTKDLEDKNALGVIDKNMQTLKGDLAAKVAKGNVDWNDALPKVVEAFNKKPHGAVYGPPSQVEKKNRGDNPQNFRILQENAQKFAHNDRLTQRRMASIRDAGGFRAPTGTRRSFLPQYGNTREVSTVGSLYVTARDGRKTLLKQAQAAPSGSGNVIQTLVDPGKNFQL